MVGTPALMRRSLRSGGQIWLWRRSNGVQHATFCFKHKLGDVLIRRVI
jgi:hypothetical protein